MSKMQWTKPQQEAIYDRGGTLLLSAAAGSGKTAVLVERVVQIISNEVSPVEIDRLLVVTFSNAAASEMKQRVGVRLSQMISQQPDNIFLQKQQAMLSSANISTVHSFCLELIRQNFQELGVSPDFSVIDEAELDLLKKECVLESIEEFYEREDTREIFVELVELLTSGRDDRRVMETVFRIYDFARSHPFYKQWLDEKLKMYDTTKPVGETVWGQSILRYAQDSLAYYRKAMEQALALIDADEKLTKGYLPMFQFDLQQLRSVEEVCRGGHWDQTVHQLRDFVFDRLGSVRGECPDKETVQAIRQDLRDGIEELKERYLNATEQEFKEDIEDLQPKIEVLFELVKNFGDRLDEEKRSRKKLDFSDLEHLTLQLLAHEDHTPTQHAKEISEQYEYVLVDEYQDTNEVQDLIFSSISRREENLFMVGDVKQSIYSFRMAMPEIFMHKKKTYHSYNETDYPAALLLDTNFRSRKEVTDSVNFIFGQIMSEEMGEISYTKEESLKPGADFLPYAKASPELLLLNAEDYTGELDYLELEAMETARKIKELLEGGYQVQVREGDKTILRPAKPSDICILLRSHRNKAEVYIDSLTQVGVPAWAEASGGFLQAREISAVVSLLRVLDNPLLDIELAAVLLSPLFDFTNDDIAAIRLVAKDQPLYVALFQAAEKQRKAAEVVELLQSLRRYAASHSADDLLMEIYRQTNLLEVVRVMPLGESRHANLLLFLEYAAHYDAMGYKGLSGFVAFLERMEERDGDLAPANILGDSADVVRVMSIHRSKGLEFPIVILADTAKEFNLMDLREPTLLHSEYGFASVRRDPKTLAQYPTVPMGAIRLELEKTLRSEEMRVLYVAMTRAKEKLIVVSTIRRNFSRSLGNLVETTDEEGKPSSFRVGRARSYSDWILMSLFSHPSAHPLREAAGNPEISLLSCETPWEISIVTPTGEHQGVQDRQLRRSCSPNTERLHTLKRRFSYEYPHQIQTTLPSKMAVSDVVLGEKNVTYRFTRRPRFLTKGGLTPAEKGTAMHSFMQFANYERARDDLPAEVKRMEQDGYLSKIQVENLALEKLHAFFHSSLAQRIFSSDTVHRELRFMTEAGREELAAVLGDMDKESKIVIQGVADCVFVEHGNAIILDYKTDRVASLQQLREVYQPQLELYQHILTDSLNLPVTETILYSFYLSDWTDTMKDDENTLQ